MLETCSVMKWSKPWGVLGNLLIYVTRNKACFKDNKAQKMTLKMARKSMTMKLKEEGVQGELKSKEKKPLLPPSEGT